MSFDSGSKHQLQDGTEWQFASHLSTEHVWDAFVIYSLLDDKAQHRQQLCVAHTGDQAHRFTHAMEERNRKIILSGQPDAILHACDKCFRTYKIENGDICQEFQLSTE